MDYTQGRGRILANVEVAPDHYRMEIEAPFVPERALPGQFVMVKVTDGLAPVLRRPFGIYTINEARGSFEMIYRVVGEGTRLLSEMADGVDIDVLGPLGNGFNLDLAGDQPLIVAGGVGVPPLFSLAQGLIGKGKKPVVIIGGRTADDLLSLDAFRAIGIEPLLATEDGSSGYKGYVTAIMEERLDDGKIPSAVYSCGPKLMLRRVGEIAMSRGIPCELSLEAIMACGFGVCLGCVVKTCSSDGSSEHDFSRVCCEGPVFDAKEIIWDEA
ncbi:MAG: dihydroorotate dehydrogenase electron transfer subunit [Proteobacteria bacterium]|nr:dihydroorotate dehydrogenase electron transfer subunit [Pseudomonadota bacterium]